MSKKTRRGRTANELGTEILDAACAKWKQLPSRTLARLLFNKHKGIFSSIEAARSGVLYRRGRKKSPHPGASWRSSPSSAPTHPWNPQGYLPASDEKPFLPFLITVKRPTRALILGDIHIPYHNLPALTAALKEGQRRGCQIVILNGDTLDFYRLSRFQKDPSRRNVKGELERANQLLDVIDELFPKARKVWKDGNHDERFAHYLQANAPELFEIVSEKASLPALLDIEARGWEYVTDKRPIYLGELPLIHGHEYPTPVLGPVNAARGLFLRTKECAMVNHHHQTSEHTETSLKGKMITTWSIGCLCELHPEYARFNKWNHGAATVEVYADGTFSTHNFRIHEGKIMNAA